MSEHKTPTETLQEIEYEIDKLSRENHEMKLKVSRNSDKINNLLGRRASLLCYLNSDSDSINQDKTE